MTGDDRRPLLCRQPADETTWYSIAGFVLGLGYPLIFPLKKHLERLRDEAKPTDSWRKRNGPRCFLAAFHVYALGSWFFPGIVLLIFNFIGVTSLPLAQFAVVAVLLTTFANLLLYAVVLSVE